MVITYENLFALSDFQLKSCAALNNLNIFRFLSFQDAFHYLIKAYDLKGKKILVPMFYCDATIRDMEAHGLHVQLCYLDEKNFDVDVAKFIQQLQAEQPDIIIIYNFYGKRSQLYDHQDWKRYIKPGAMIVSDFAHSLIPHHPIEFFNDKHFYIDSTRKTTSQMTAHLIMPPHVQVNKALCQHYALFKWKMRILFLLKSWCLRLATFFNTKFFSDLGMQLYTLHDKYIGSPKSAFTGFWWDGFLYKHINFEKIRCHRRWLYHAYKQRLAGLASQGHIALFDLPLREEENICFFFIRITRSHHIAALIKLLQDHGFWAEVLWDFDALQGIPAQTRDWAKSIVVLPYTLRTKLPHINAMAALMESFFNQAETMCYDQYVA